MSEKKRETLVTPTGRIVFTKNTFTPDEHGKYKLTLLFNKDQDLAGLKNLMSKTGLAAFSEEEYNDPDFKKGLKPAKPKQIKKYDFMNNNTIVLNASTKYPIPFKSVTKGPDGQLEDLFENDVTAGDYVRAIVSCYTFDTDNNQGVSFNVSGVQRVKETEEPLYQPTPVDSVFADVSFDIEPEVQAEANTEEW